MDSLFLALHGVAVLGTAYVGFCHGPQLKALINGPSLKVYREWITFNSNGFFNEDNCCRITTTLCGALIGRMLWPVTIPISAAYVERKHGDAIRAFIRRM